jgi:hypothetical protein
VAATCDRRVLLGSRGRLTDRIKAPGATRGSKTPRSQILSRPFAGKWQHPPGAPDGRNTYGRNMRNSERNNVVPVRSSGRRINASYGDLNDANEHARPYVGACERHG